MALQIFGHPHQHSQAARRSTRARAYHCYLRNSLYAIKIARRWTILILLPKPIIEFELPEEIKNKYKKLREPVSRLRKALYGLRRSGFDFINALRKTLIEDGWSAVEGDPAVLVLRNGQSHKNVAVCATYVDDILRSSPKALEKSIWNKLSKGFRFDPPRPTQKFLGIVPKALKLIGEQGSQQTEIALPQRDVAMFVVQKYEKETGPRQIGSTSVRHPRKAWATRLQRSQFSKIFLVKMAFFILAP